MQPKPYDSIILISSGKEICRGRAAIVLFELRQKQREEMFQALSTTLQQGRLFSGSCTLNIGFPG